MKTNGIVALSALAAIAAAIPLNKRQEAYSTTTDIVVETVWTTTTVWVEPTADSAPSQSVGGFFESYSQPSASSVPAVVTPSVQSPAPQPPATTSTSSTSTYVPPPAPTTTTTQAPDVQQPATTSAAPAAATSAASYGSSSGQGQYSGDATYYDVSVGLGSCGWQGSNSQDLVAIASDVMDNGANPNDNPKCGKTITIYYNGNTHTATVYDTCPTCAGGSIDLTQELFQKVAPDGDGRVHGVSWSFD